MSKKPGKCRAKKMQIGRHPGLFFYNSECQSRSSMLSRRKAHAVCSVSLSSLNDRRRYLNYSFHKRPKNVLIPLPHSVKTLNCVDHFQCRIPMHELGSESRSSSSYQGCFISCHSDVNVCQIWLNHNLTTRGGTSYICKGTAFKKLHFSGHSGLQLISYLYQNHCPKGVWSCQGFLQSSCSSPTSWPTIHWLPEKMGAVHKTWEVFLLKNNQNNLNIHIPPTDAPPTSLKHNCDSLSSFRNFASVFNELEAHLSRPMEAASTCSCHAAGTWVVGPDNRQ